MMKTLCFLFLCSLTVVHSETVTIGALGATTTTPPAKMYVGPLKLVDDPALGFTLDFNATFGTGANEVGLKLQVGAKTNDNPGCTEFKTVKTDVSFQMIMPSAVTDLFASSALACLGASCTLGVAPAAVSLTGLDILPDLSQLTEEIKMPQVTFDVSALTPPFEDYELPLSPKLGADKEKVMNFLGIEVTIVLALSELKVYKKGMEVPVYLKVEILKKSIMTTPGSDNCGAMGDKICGTESCGTGVTIEIGACTACKAICTGMGTILDAITGTTDATAAVDKKYDVLKELKTFAKDQSITLPNNIQDCATDAAVTCMRIGKADACPVPKKESESDDLDGARTNSFYLMSYLAIFAIFALYEL